MKIIGEAIHNGQTAGHDYLYNGGSLIKGIYNQRNDTSVLNKSRENHISLKRS